MLLLPPDQRHQLSGRCPLAHSRYPRQPPTVALGSLAATYNGSAKAATATTTSAGLSVNPAYDGSATAPTGTGHLRRGWHDQRYLISGRRHWLTRAYPRHPLRLPSVAWLQPIHGNPKSAIAATTPAGLLFIFTYDAGASAPHHRGHLHQRHQLSGQRPWLTRDT